MASNAEWSLGDHLEIGNGGTPLETFTEIPELRNITFNRGVRTRVDTSSHNSTAPYRDNIPTFFENGQITADCNYLPRDTVHKLLESKLDSDDPTTFRFVVEADAGDVVFQGKAYVVQFTPTSNFEDARRANLVLDITGAWTRVAGS